MTGVPVQASLARAGRPSPGPAGGLPGWLIGQFRIADPWHGRPLPARPRHGRQVLLVGGQPGATAPLGGMAVITVKIRPESRRVQARPQQRATRRLRPA